MRFQTNTDDISIFFNVIQETKPTSVLDVGMMLVTNNIIDRQAGEIMISDDTKLYALKPDSFQVFPVYENVYEEIFDIKAVENHQFELAVYLGDSILGEFEKARVLAKYILTDDKYTKYIENTYSFRRKNVEYSGEKKYYTYIDCNQNQYV